MKIHLLLLKDRLDHYPLAESFFLSGRGNEMVLNRNFISANGQHFLNLQVF